MKVLIIEDEKSLAEMVADRLRREKYSVDISFDGEDGSMNFPYVKVKNGDKFKLNK